VREQQRWEEGRERREWEETAEASRRKVRAEALGKGRAQREKWLHEQHTLAKPKLLANTVMMAESSFWSSIDMGHKHAVLPLRQGRPRMHRPGLEAFDRALQGR
jgi:hypothetical protein